MQSEHLPLARSSDSVNPRARKIQSKAFDLPPLRDDDLELPPLRQSVLPNQDDVPGVTAENCRTLVRPTHDVAIVGDGDPAQCGNFWDPYPVWSSRCYDRTGRTALVPRVARVSDVIADLPQKLCEAEKVRIDVEADRHGCAELRGQCCAVHSFEIESGDHVVEGQFIVGRESLDRLSSTDHFGDDVGRNPLDRRRTEAQLRIDHNR